jgi:hypothetical protein
MISIYAREKTPSMENIDVRDLMLVAAEGHFVTVHMHKD